MILGCAPLKPRPHLSKPYQNVERALIGFEVSVVKHLQVPLKKSLPQLSIWCLDLLCKPLSQVLRARYVLSDAPRQRMMREDMKH